jgi:hypothetical protein
MTKFRIRIWKDGSFWRTASYAVAPDTATVRRRLEREHGRDTAKNSAVTAFASCPPANRRVQGMKAHVAA